MKYQKVLLCLALTGALLFTGCGATNNPKENTTVSAELSTEAETANDKTSTENAEGTTVTGMVSSVSDTELTIASMPENAQGEKPGEPPTDGNSNGSSDSSSDRPGEPPTDADSNGSDSSSDKPGEPPTDSNSDGSDSSSDKPNEPPTGGNGSGDQAGGAPDMSNLETQTIPLTDTTTVLDKDGNETDLSALSEGVMVTVTLDDSGNAPTITISDPSNMQTGAAPGGSSAPASYTAANTYTEDTEVSGETFTSTGTDENAILVDEGANVSLSDITLNRESSDSTGGDNSSFYGVGAGILALDGNLTIADSNIETDAAGAAGIFAYGDGNVTVSDTTISTKQDTSGGIHVAGGGTLTAKNLTVTTEGASSAAIRSDRGGGTLDVTGGSYTSNGSGSPAVYCTADISIADAALTATASEAVCIEGLNSLTLKNCDLTGDMPENEQNDCTWTVILYQSMSGDSEVGNSTFSMTGGSLTSKNGGLFYTTNTESTFYLSDVTLNNSDSDDFLLKCTGNSNARGWGTAGANGADCKFTADTQTMEGSIIWDSISTLDVSLANGSVWTGAFIQDESNAGNGGDGYANLSVDSSSTWIVTGDSTLSSLSCAGTIQDAKGNTVTIQGTDGTVYVEGTSSYTITVTSYEA